jgi:hypothetical protein
MILQIGIALFFTALKIQRILMVPPMAHRNQRFGKKVKDLSPEELSENVIELERSWRQEAQARAEDEKRHRKELMDAKKAIIKEVRQASGQVRKKEKEVSRMESRISLVDRQKDTFGQNKGRTSERFDQRMARCQEQRMDFESNLAVRSTELGEARGRLAHARFAEQMLEKGVIVPLYLGDGSEEGSRQSRPGGGRGRLTDTSSVLDSRLEMENARLLSENQELMLRLEQAELYAREVEAQLDARSIPIRDVPTSSVRVATAGRNGVRRDVSDGLRRDLNAQQAPGTPSGNAPYQIATSVPSTPLSSSPYRMMSVPSGSMLKPSTQQALPFPTAGYSSRPNFPSTTPVAPVPVPTAAYPGGMRSAMPGAAMPGPAAAYPGGMPAVMPLPGMPVPAAAFPGGMPSPRPVAGLPMPATGAYADDMPSARSIASVSSAAPMAPYPGVVGGPASPRLVSGFSAQVPPTLAGSPQAQSRQIATPRQSLAVANAQGFAAPIGTPQLSFITPEVKAPVMALQPEVTAPVMVAPQFRVASPPPPVSRQTSVAGGGQGYNMYGSLTDVVFDAVDSNHDGVVTRSEFRAGLKNHVISRGDLM